MRFFKLIFVGFFVLFFNESRSQSSGLGQSFLLSLKEQKFELLKDHFPTVEFFKSLPETSKRSNTEINSFLKQGNDRLKENWKNISDRLKTEKIDISKIELQETLVYDPFGSKNEMLGMVLVYKYDNKTWDDLTLIVSQWKDKTFLLEIPNPTRAFTFYDETLRASNDAKTSMELKKPEFKNSLEEIVKRIISEAKENNLDAFAAELVYRGDDESRKWKTPININNEVEKQQIAQFMKRLLKVIEPCNNYQIGDIRSDRESEGIWIVLQLNCGEKIVSFAFLKIGDKLLLGDIDSETKE